ncbi:MAG: hypothetical protein JOZ22_08540 [Acidobacteriia bacterium]|nr:hypothetical protein [Terriglobia bacterium]
MVLVGHIPFYKEIFAIPGFLADPVLCFGFQEFDHGATLDDTQYLHLGQYVAALGMRALSLDLFDPRSELRYDMNDPVPESEHGRYGTLIDIGSLEHVFDTRQCFENCLRMVATGGHYLLHTPVNGYYGHGFHVFNPEALLGALQENGFQVIYAKYSGMDGAKVTDPSLPGDVLAWIVARKERETGKFVCPQQGKWFTRYGSAG